MKPYARPPRRPTRSCWYLLPLLLALSPPAALADDRDAARIYEQGLQAYDQGDHRAAVIHLKNALQMDPTILPAHILLGRAYLDEGSGGAAERELQIALKLGADRSLVLPALGKSYILQRKFKQVVEEIYPTTGDSAVDEEILLLRGESHLELDELDLADRAFDQAAALKPDDAAPLVGKANVLLKRGDDAAAEAEVITAIQREPDDPRAWLLRGTIAHGRGEIQAALAHYEKALALDPKGDAAQLARLGTLIDLGRDGEAAEVARKYRADFPSDPRAAYLLSLVLSRSGDSAGARQALDEAYALLSAIPDEVLQAHGPSYLLAGVVAFTLGKTEEAQARLDRYIGLYPPAPGARRLMAALMMQRGDTKAAIETLEPALAVEPTNSRLLLMLGEAYMREGRHHPAGELFERALQLAPDSTDARVQRAINRLAGGQKEAAVEELATVFAEKPDLARVGTLLSDIYIKQGNAAAAVRVLERLIELEPDNLGHRNQLALVLAGSGRLKEARDALNQILVRDPAYTAADLNLARLDLLVGQAKDAAARYQIILKRDQNEARAMVGLAQALAAQGDTTEATRWLEKIVNLETEDAAEAKLDAVALLVDILIRTGQPERALTAAQQAEVRAAGDHRVLTALGKANVAMGEKVVAHNLYRRLSGDAGYDALRLFEVARLQFLADDLDGALWSITKAAEAEPRFTDARVKQIELLDASGKRDEALKAARALVEAQADQAEAHRVLGDVLLRGGDKEGALAAYQQAATLAPSQAAAIRLARVHLALGQQAKARELLRQRLARSPGERAVREALAEIYLGTGDRAKARQEYEALVEGGSGTAAQYNNLAVIYQQDGDARAQEYARRAIALDPESPAANDTLGWLLVQGGDIEGGLGYLRKAEARAAQDLEIRYHIGVALHRLGRAPEARAELERALAAGRPFEGEEQAKTLLQGLRP